MHSVCNSHPLSHSYTHTHTHTHPHTHTHTHTQSWYALPTDADGKVHHCVSKHSSVLTQGDPGLPSHPSFSYRHTFLPSLHPACEASLPPSLPPGHCLCLHSFSIL